MRDEDEWLEWAGGLTAGVNFEPSATFMGLEGILADFNAVLFSKDEEDQICSCLSKKIRTKNVKTFFEDIFS